MTFGIISRPVCSGGGGPAILYYRGVNRCRSTVHYGVSIQLVILTYFCGRLRIVLCVRWGCRAIVRSTICDDWTVQGNWSIRWEGRLGKRLEAKKKILK